MNPIHQSENAMGESRYKEMKVMAKKFVSQREGAELYCMGLTKFRELAEEAGALYKVGKSVLINTEIFEEYLESFRIERY